MCTACAGQVMLRPHISHMGGGEMGRRLKILGTEKLNESEPFVLTDILTVNECDCTFQCMPVNILDNDHEEIHVQCSERVQSYCPNK